MPTGALNFRTIISAAALLATTLVVGLPSANAQTGEGQTGEMKTVAVIAATNYDELITDIDYLGQFGGQVKAGQQMNNMLLLFTQNKGLQGLDKSKPWGAVVQTDGNQFVPVVCLPVTDLDSLLELVNVFGMATSEVEDGITEIEVPNQSLYVKKDGNWAYLAQSPEMLATPPADPSELFAQLTKEYDFATRIMVQNVPEIYRSLAVDQLRAGAEQGLQQNEGESDEEFAARRQSTEASIEQVAQAMNELDEIMIGFNSDSEQGGAYLDFVYSGIEGSNFAKAITVYKAATTKFGGCIKDDAAVRMNISVTTPAELVEQYRDQSLAQMQSMRQQVNNGIDKEMVDASEEVRATVKDAVADLLDAFEATALSGHMDIAGSMDSANGTLSVRAGGYSKEPAKVESALKKLASLLEEEASFSGVKWNAESHAGANIHTMSIDVPEEEDEARKMFGEKLNVAVAIGTDSVYFAAGSDALADIKGAMTSSASEAKVKPVQFSVALTPLLQLATQVEPDPTSIAVLEALVTKGADADHVHITMEEMGGKLRGRLELESGVLEAIGAAIMAAQRQGAGAGF